MSRTWRLERKLKHRWPVPIRQRDNVTTGRKQYSFAVIQQNMQNYWFVSKTMLSFEMFNNTHIKRPWDQALLAQEFSVMTNFTVFRRMIYNHLGWPQCIRSVLRTANYPSNIFLRLLSGLESWAGVTWGWCYRGEWGGGTLSSKNSRGTSGVQRENTGTSFHNHNIGTTKWCPQTTIICQKDFWWKSKNPKESLNIW